MSRLTSGNSRIHLPYVVFRSLMLLVPLYLWSGEPLRAQTIHPGEIAIRGTIEDVNINSQVLKLRASSVRFPNGKVTRLPTPRAKQVNVGPSTVILRFGDSTHLLRTPDLPIGAGVEATGEDRGVGSALTAREITLLSLPKGVTVNRPPSEPPTADNGPPAELPADLNLAIVQEVNRQIRRPNHVPDLHPSSILAEAARLRAVHTAALIPEQGWGPWLHLQSSDPWDITRVLTRLHARNSPFAENMELMTHEAGADGMVENFHWETDEVDNPLLDRAGNRMVDDHWRSLMNPRLRLLGAAVVPLDYIQGGRYRHKWLIMLEATGGSSRTARRSR